MIFKDDIFVLNGRRFRLLTTDTAKNVAWIIELGVGAWPQAIALSAISGLHAERTGEAKSDEREPTTAEKNTRDRAMAALLPLLENKFALFDEVKRCALIKKHAQLSEVSTTSLYKWLRMYWENGQCAQALTPVYKNCGRSETTITGGRGARSKKGVEAYELTNEDIKKFEDVMSKVYFKEKSRARLVDVFETLTTDYYNYLDGNGETFVKEAGSRPTMRQFRHFLKRAYPLEDFLRRGKKQKYELEHRPVIGTVEQDCLGVGHIFECDATIADVYLTDGEKQTHVGKPTIYVIVDRWSRLIVGLYVGFENASWTTAMQALLFISEDKEALCRRYGVEYDPDDWPADCVFPHTFLADMGEVHSEAGMKLSESLYTNVAFVPARRGDWKPVVETTFKQVRTTLQPGTPGFDPPENARERQALNYSDEACLTLRDFTKLMLELVLKHNRQARRNYDFTMAELTGKFIPSPINVWNKEIVTRSGALSRYSYEHVRYKLLPREQAVATENGLLFKGCFYTNKELFRRNWFTRVKGKTWQKVEVAFDHRLVDNIYVVTHGGSGEPLLCELTPKSELHRGRSFAEVAVYNHLRGIHSGEVEQNRLQAAADYREATRGTINDAVAALASAPKRSKSARKKDTKVARGIARSEERQDTGSLKAQPSAQTQVPPKTTSQSTNTAILVATTPKVIDFGSARAKRQPSDSVATSAAVPTPVRVTTSAGHALPDKALLAQRAMERMRLRSTPSTQESKP